MLRNLNTTMENIVKIEPINDHRIGGENFYLQWSLGNTCNWSCEYCPTVLHAGDRYWPEYNNVISFLNV